MVDTVISLTVIAIMVLVYASLVNVRALNRRTQFRVQAAAIVDEQISTLKRFDISALPNQTNGPFLGMVYNAGRWAVTGNAEAGHSGPNAYEFVKPTGFGSAISGRMLYPAGSYADATWEFAFSIRSDSAANGAVGLFFRASDAENGYRLLIAPTGADLDSSVGGPQNWVLEQVVNGSVLTPRLVSTNVNGITTDSWHTAKVIASSTSLKTFLDGNGQDSGSVVDSSFTDGPAALVTWGNVHALFDDASTTVGMNTSSWNFDGSAEVPAAWVRFGLNDLPDGTDMTFEDNGRLTLTAYPNTNSTTLKEATLRVSWVESGRTASYSSTVLLGSSRIGQ